MEVLEGKPGQAKIELKEDGILKVAVDLNVTNEMFIETRVGAYGALEWARELATRFIMNKEIQYVRAKAERDAKHGVVVPGVVNIKGMKIDS